MTRNPRVTLIGPLPPLRGGIAQHTEALREALARRSELLALSFRRLYPNWLFPGASPYEPGEGGVPAVPDPHGVRFSIDALGPRTWWRAVRVARDHGSARVVLPWWTAALAPPTRTIVRGCRAAGISTTFLCHNVVDHESAWWKRALARSVLRPGSRFVVASEAEAARLRDLLPGAAVAVHPHPVYRHFPATVEALPRRSRRELLFFGLLRPYKGLDVLVGALEKAADVEWHLTIAGEPWQETDALKARLRGSALDARVEWIERYVSSEEAAALFQRADAVVLPYRHATGCGVLALALGQGKPVVASDLPGLREQIVDGQTGWLVPPGDADALARALRDVDEDACRAMRPAVHALARRWTWDSLARTVLDDG